MDKIRPLRARFPGTTFPHYFAITGAQADSADYLRKEAGLCDRCRSIVMTGSNVVDNDCKNKLLFEHGLVKELLSPHRICSFCSLVTSGFNLRRLTSRHPHLLDYKLLLSGNSSPFSFHCSLGRPNEAGEYEEDDEYNLMSFKLSATPGSLASPFFPNNIPRNPKSREAFKLAGGWLSDCLNRHGCGHSTDTELPTRVLDVNVREGPDQLRLYVPLEGPVQRGKYVTLSYCWGSSSSFKTTSDTLAERKRGICLADLPSTLRDAVLVTRKLGYRYLWIDALCILQGEDQNARDDWKRESDRMESIYGNALLTIVAAASKNCDEGLFYHGCSSLPFRLRRGHGRQVEGLVNVVPSKPYVAYENEPINSRAWTLQERLLSPRTLMYGTEEMVWQCDEAFLGEMSSERSKMPYDSAIYGFRLTKSPRRRDWIMIVQEYTRRNLTISEDKLPALAGIARRYHRLTGDRYVAGLWRSTLLPDILWDCPRSGRCYSKLSSYRAPSWSWASTDSAVVFIAANVAEGPRYCAEIVECNVEPAGLEQFGSVANGELVVRGPFKQAGRIGLHESSQTVFANDQEVENELIVASAKFDEGDTFIVRQGKEAKPVWCLLISKRFIYYGLLLTPYKLNHYNRIGVFASSTQEQKQWFEDAAEKTVSIL